MKRALLDDFAARSVAFDTETALVQPGLLAPPLVCGSVATYDAASGQFATQLLDVEQTLEAFVALLKSNRIIVGAFIAYDMLVCATELAKRGVDVMPLVFAKYERGEVYDILLAQALDAIYWGHLAKDPRTGGDMRDPITGETTNRYGLAIVVYYTLGRKDAKVNDRWRMSYALLRGIPISQWPPEARDYPQDDVRNTLEAALAQCGIIPQVVEHEWQDVAAPLLQAMAEYVGADGTRIGTMRVDGTLVRADGSVLSTGDSICRRCGHVLGAGESPPCRETRRHKNLHSLSDQVYMGWAMQLGAAWGFNVDQEAVNKIEEDVLAEREKYEPDLLAWKFLKVKAGTGVEADEDDPDSESIPSVYSKDKAAVSRAVALAFGAHGTCGTCTGTSKVTSPRAPLVRCKPCKGGGVIAGVACVGCFGQGKVTSQAAGYKINCKECCATGLDLSTAPTVPMTDASVTFPRGQVQSSRDACFESGDPRLEALATYEKSAKTIKTYIPYLRTGRVAVTTDHTHNIVLGGAGVDGASLPTPVVWRNRPLTLKPNPLLETDRTSYSDPIQQFPREGDLRACICARPGYVLASVDYAFGELITHAQSCLWILGYSDLGDALLSGLEPHKSLAASMAGATYETLDQWFRDKTHEKHKLAKNLRQGAKIGNFGFGGGMGALKLVIQQRQNGPDTPCPNGPIWITDGKNPDGTPRKVRGYKGTRLCIIMGGDDRCGSLPDGTPNTVQEWGKEGYERECKPTCRRCLECADELREFYSQRWSEAKPYQRHASRVSEVGQTITSDDLARWPHLREVYEPGEQLPPGAMMQHHSGIVRGGCKFTDVANGWFQSLLAVAAKLAFRRAQRECCDATVIVGDGAYAGRRSPLLGSRIVVFQHDECLAELLKVAHDGYTAHDSAHRLSEIMVRALQQICPALAPVCKAPPAMMARWLKSAEPVYLCGLCGKRSDSPCATKGHGATCRLVEWVP